MRVLVTGAGGFVGAHVDRELERAGHERLDLTVDGPRTVARAWAEPADAVIHLSTAKVRDALDLAWATGAEVVVLLSAVGGSAAEELVRAGGLRWAIVRPEILWGPGDVFTNELAHLLRHLPFVPSPRGGAVLAPVHAADAARALIALLDAPERWHAEWTLLGPERLAYPEIVARVAAALGHADRRRIGVPAWLAHAGLVLEEWLDRRPRSTRILLDRLIAGSLSEPLPRLETAPTRLTVDALHAYLGRARGPAEQLRLVMG